MGGVPTVVRANRVRYDKRGWIRYGAPVDMAVFSDGTVRFKGNPDYTPPDQILDDLTIDDMPPTWLLLQQAQTLPSRIRPRLLAVRMPGGIRAMMYFLGIEPRPRNLAVAALGYIPHHIGTGIRVAEASYHYYNVHRAEADAIEARNAWHQMILQRSTVGIEPADSDLQEHFPWIAKEHWKPA
jgi:hypothetical protein